MPKNTLRNPPQPRNQLPTTQSLSRYPTCVTIPVTCRRCLPSLAPPYPLKLPPNRHIMAYGKKHAAKPPTTTEPTPHNTKSLHISNVRHHPRHIPSLPPLSRTPLSPKITPKPSHYGLWEKTPCETPHNNGTNSPQHKFRHVQHSKSYVDWLVQQNFFLHSIDQNHVFINDQKLLGLGFGYQFLEFRRITHDFDRSTIPQFSMLLPKLALFINLSLFRTRF
jgi:hypothetical protein